MDRRLIFRHLVTVLLLSLVLVGGWVGSGHAWMSAAIQGSGAVTADVTAPVVSTVTIGTDGTTITLAMTEAVDVSGQDDDEFNLDCDGASGANVAMTYSSGTGTSSLVFTTGATVIQSGETCNMDYSNAQADEFEDGPGNDLGSPITDKETTNNSTQGGATDYSADANCVGYWRMEGTGDESDNSGEGHTITDTNEVVDATNTSLPSGFSGYYRSFSRATNNYFTLADVSCGSLDINGADQDISIFVRVRPVATTYSGSVSILAGKSGQYTLQITFTADNQFRVDFIKREGSPGFNTQTLSSTTTNYAVASWYSIAGVYNDTDMRIYVNGSLDCTPLENNTGILNDANPFTVGLTGNNLNGDIYEVGIFNRELSSAEVSEIHSNGIDGVKEAP